MVDCSSDGASQLTPCRGSQPAAIDAGVGGFGSDSDQERQIGRRQRQHDAARALGQSVPAAGSPAAGAQGSPAAPTNDGMPRGVSRPVNSGKGKRLLVGGGGLDKLLHLTVAEVVGFRGHDDGRRSDGIADREGAVLGIGRRQIVGLGIRLHH